MVWRTDLTPSGWRISMGDRARGESWAEFRPDRHGRVKKMQGSAGAGVTLAAVQAACATAREAMPPRPHGVFYGGRSSLIRGEFCDLVAAAMNAREGV